MAKRSAASDLNQDNWNTEDDKEEAGHFTPLSGSELQNRVIKKAKRSLNSSSLNSSGAGVSPFAKFSGFASSSSPFGSLKKTDGSGISGSFGPTTKKSEEKTNGSQMKQEKGPGDAKPNTSLQSKPQEKQTRGLEYYRQLQSLNESVLKWIQLHYEKNACSDFTPVFNDYKKHLDTLNFTYPVRMKEDSTVSQSKDSFTKTVSGDQSFENESDTHSNEKSPGQKTSKDETDYGAHFSSNTTNTSTFSFGIKSTPTATSSISSSVCNSSSKEEAKMDDEENKPASSGFFKPPQNTNTSTSNFGMKSTTTATSSISSSGCNSSTKEETIKSDEDNKPSTQFSFGFFKPPQTASDKPFSFACAAPAEKSETGEEKEYVPPKNEFVAVAEEDAIYSKRCKLFFKKDEVYAEKGVGTLYLKKLDGKTQLLVRADTSLGNILLNIMLNASLPMSRTGKNNVLIVCIPNPPVDAKNPNSKEAIPVLIRVKTAEDADELLETFNKHKS